MAHQDDIRTIAFSPFGDQMATAGSDGVINIWDTESWEKITGLTHGHHDWVTNVAFFQDGKRLASSGRDGKLLIWELVSQSLMKSTNVGAPMNDFAIAKDDELIVTGNDYGVVGVYHTSDLSLERKYDGLGITKINGVETDPDANVIFVAGVQYQMKVLDNIRHKVRETFKTPRGVTSIALSPVMNKISCVTYHGFLKTFDMDYPSVNIPDHAYGYYNYLQAQKDLSHLQERLRSYLLEALLNYSKKMIVPFVNGDDILPGVDQLAFAKRHLATAGELYPENVYIKEEIEVLQALLNAFQVVAENDFMRLKEAIGDIESVIDQQPDASYTYNSLSAIYQKLNEMEKAIETVDVAGKRIPDWTEPKINKGKAYLKQFEYENAIRQFEEVIAVQPDLAKGYVLKGQVFSRIGMYDSASFYFGMAAEKDTGSISNKLQEALLLIRTGNEAKAIEELKHHINHYPDYVPFYYLLGELYHLRLKEMNTQTGKKCRSTYFQALALLRQAHDIAPNNLDVKVALADLYRTAYEHFENMSRYKKKRFLDGQKIQNEKGSNRKRYSSSERYQLMAESRKLYNDAAAANPYCLKAINGQARWYALKKSAGKAKDKYKNMIDKMPDNPYTHFCYANYLVERNKKHKSWKAYRKALSVDPKHVPSYVALFEGIQEGKLRQRHQDWVVEKLKNNLPKSELLYNYKAINKYRLSKKY